MPVIDTALMSSANNMPLGNVTGLALWSSRYFIFRRPVRLMMADMTAPPNLRPRGNTGSELPPPCLCGYKGYQIYIYIYIRINTGFICLFY